MAEKKGVTNLYGIIGVDENADETAIKKAYRNLVLRWHPDKNPADRPRAEEQIRLINAAYATLSNPAKRERYDLQRFAQDKQRRGVVPKPKVSPKMETPKEFMMQPMGHMDRFLRCVEKRVLVQARHDVKATFDEFFQQTKLSLWWVPEVNNKCRIRNLGSKTKVDKKAAAKGLAGGLHFSFRAKAGFESEVMLTQAMKGQKSDLVDFVAKASPEFEGALRFETACRRGHYLAFLPPSDLRVVPFLNEQPGRVLDFTLVDWASNLNFKDIDEVLIPVGAASPGSWVPISKFRQSEEVRAYFEKVLRKPLWDAEDFAAYFEGHWIDWDYISDSQTARLRPPEERLGQVLHSSASFADALLGVARAGEELTKMPLLGALRAVQLLTSDPGKREEEKEEEEKKPQGKRKKEDAKEEKAAPGASKQQQAVQRKLLSALRGILSAAPREALAPLSASELLEAAERVPLLVGEEPTPEVLEDRADALKLLTHMVVAKVTASEEAPATGEQSTEAPATGEQSTEAPASGELSAEDLIRALRLPGLTMTEEAVLTKALGPSLTTAPRSELLQVIHAAVARSCHDLARAVADRALAGLEGLGADEAVLAIAELAEAGASAESLAPALAARAGAAGVRALARALLAACGASAAGGEAAAGGLGAAAQAFAAKAPLAGLSSETLLSLAVASAKVPAAGPMLPAVLEAVSKVMDGWPAGDFVKLLLAAKKGRDHLPQDARDALLAKAEAMLMPKLADLYAADVVKIVLAVSGHGPSQLLEAVAKEAAIRLPDFAPAQLLLVTQGLVQGLPSSHESLLQIMQFWPDLLARAAAARAATPAGKPVGPGGLVADQLAKLATAVAPWLAAEGEGKAAEAARRRLAGSLGKQLLELAEEISEPSREPLAAQLKPDGPFGSFAKRGALRGAVLRPRRKRSRSRDTKPTGAEAAAPGRRKKKRRR